MALFKDLQSAEQLITELSFPQTHESFRGQGANGVMFEFVGAKRRFTSPDGEDDAGWNAGFGLDTGKHRGVPFGDFAPLSGRALQRAGFEIARRCSEFGL